MLEAGAGGRSDRTDRYRTIYDPFPLSYAEIIIENGSVTGGIEIQIKGGGINKKYTASKTATSKTINKLKSGKTYKVRVRAYKKSGSVRHVSKWSSWKSAKAK